MTLSIASSGRRTLMSYVGKNLCGPSIVPRRTRFEIPHDLRKILTDFRNKTDSKEYEELVCSIRDFEIEDAELSQLLHDCRENISLLNKSVHHLVHVIVKIKWVNRSEATVSDYQGFLVDLLSAHNYYTKLVFDELIAIFKLDFQVEEWDYDVLSTNSNVLYDYVHEVLNVVLQTVPMSVDLLKETIEAQFPYLRKSAEEHVSYVYNILRVLDYQPTLRTDILFLLVNRFILLDLNSPKHEIMEAENAPEDEQFEMDLDDSKEKITRHTIADTYDRSLNILLKYLYSSCYDTSVQPPELKWEETKKLFQELLSVFDCLILPTHATHHIQFIVFFMCSFKMQLADMFLLHLWQKVTSTRVANIMRQTAVAYFSSYLARSESISLRIMMNHICAMTNWIHNYIAKQDGADSTRPDLRVHPVFFSVCQAVFYVVSCRYSEFVNSKKGLLFLQGLNLTKIVTCDLNPLKVCQPEIVQSFATITRNYQLAYCYTIIEHNSRTRLPVVHVNEHGIYHKTSSNEILETFFPFDPFVLKRSSKFISQSYHELKAPFSEERMCSVGSKQDEDDDFLNGYCTNASTPANLGVSPI